MLGMSYIVIAFCIVLTLMIISLWHELRVVLQNRENALLTKAVKAFASEEQSFADRASSNWVSLGNAVEAMPYE